MMRLRHARTRLGPGRQAIAFDDKNSTEVITEHARHQPSGHARTNHDNSVGIPYRTLGLHEDLLLVVCSGVRAQRDVIPRVVW